MIVHWLRHRGTAYPIHRGDCVIGRAPHCFLVLSAEQVSREHAVVRVVDDRLEIETIHGLIDTLLSSIERTGHPLSRAEAVRLASVARVVSTWSRDGSLEEWSQHVARAVGQ